MTATAVSSGPSQAAMASYRGPTPSPGSTGERPKASPRRQEVSSLLLFSAAFGLIVLNAPFVILATPLVVPVGVALLLNHAF